MTSVTASEMQKNFGRWHDEAIKQPVQITKHGRETAYLISAETFNRLWSNYRRVVRTSDLSEAEIKLISSADIASENAYEIESAPPRRKSRRQRPSV